MLLYVSVLLVWRGVRWLGRWFQWDRIAGFVVPLTLMEYGLLRGLEEVCGEPVINLSGVVAEAVILAWPAVIGLQPVSDINNESLLRSRVYCIKSFLK